MSTTHTMKMARATDADMEIAYELAGLVDVIGRGDYPSTDDDEDVPDWFDEDDIDHLKALHKRIEKIAENSGAIWRVIGGFSTLSNPSNQLIDLTKDVIELHPRIVSALSAQQAIAAGAVVASYSLGELANGIEVLVQRARQAGGNFLWKVTNGSTCLNKSGEWEYEPLPSARDDEFLARCRFATAEDAISAAQALLAAV